MPNNLNLIRTASSRDRILLAGFAGGLAEVVWVSVYAALSPLRGWDVAREVTVSVFGDAVGGAWAPALGLLIHFALSIAIAAAFVATLAPPLYRRFGSPGVVGGAMLALAGIWAMNFFLVLPVLNPAFVALMPLAVTLGSKLLFGLGLGCVLAPAPSAGVVAARLR